MRRARMVHRNTTTDALTRLSAIETKSRDRDGFATLGAADFNVIRSKIYHSRMATDEAGHSPRSPRGSPARSPKRSPRSPRSPRTLDALSRTQNKAIALQEALLAHEAANPKPWLEGRDPRAPARPAWKGGGTKPAHLGWN